MLVLKANISDQEDEIYIYTRLILEIAVTTQQSRRITQNSPEETPSSLSVQGELAGRPHSGVGQLAPMETVQTDTNTIAFERRPGSVSANTRGRRAVPLTNITSSHQAHLVYLFMMHRSSPLHPRNSNLRFAWREAYPDSSELHFTGPKLTQLGYDLSSSMPAPIVAFIRALVDSRMPFEPPPAELSQQNPVFTYPTESSLSMSAASSLVFANGTLGIVPEGIRESLRLLAYEGIKISLSTLQRMAAIGSARIAKEVLALPIPS